VSETHRWEIPDLKRDLSNLHVLQFAPRVPWPLDTGAKLRNYHLARVLSQKFRMTLLAFAGQEMHLPELKNVYERIEMVKRDEGFSFGRVLRGATGNTPLPLLNYTTEEMKQALAALLNEQEFDLVQVESIHLMNYLPTIRAARTHSLVVCDWHNVESELMRQYSERDQSFARRTYARRTARLMNEAEKRALDQFDAHIVVSEEDGERLRQMNSSAQISIIENGVDAAYYANAQSESTAKNRLVFVASMDYHANIDAAINFARNVWPIVHRKKPELVFTIVGHDPSPAVRELSSITGVEVTGSVKDVRPYYVEAIAAVVPLRVGGGSRLKILEAMAAGVPVVSTTLGAEGLKVRDGDNILIDDDNRGLAEKIVNVIDNENLRTEIIAAARALTADRYDWSKLGGSLTSVYSNLLATRQ
jgi:sugar transferase (PEP-CTERM/EpsH1 system associated)